MLPVTATFQGTARYLLGGDGYPRLEPAQSTPESSGPRTRPVVGPKGQLYRLQEGTLTARKADGTLDWTRTLAGELHPPQVDAEGHLYLSSREGKVTSLDASGATRWEYQAEGSLREPPMLGGNQTVGMIVRKGIGQIVNLDSQTGQPRFRRDLMGQIIIGGPVHVGPQGNIYYFNSNEHKLHCYEPDGRSPWGFGVGDYMGTVASAPDGTLYVPRSFGDVLAIDPKTGKKLWAHRPGSTRPTVNEQGVVRSDKTVLRLNANTGDPVWAQELPQAPAGTPASDGQGNTFVASQDTVYALTTADGQPQASFQPGSGLSEPSSLPEGAMVSDQAGTVHRLSLQAEHLEQAEKAPTSQVVATESQILVGGIALPKRRS